MESLTILYQYREAFDAWDAHCVQYPHINCIKAKTFEGAKEVMYYLVTEELFRLHKNLSAWTIAQEIINYREV